MARTEQQKLISEKEKLLQIIEGFENLPQYKIIDNYFLKRTENYFIALDLKILFHQIEQNLLENPREEAKLEYHKLELQRIQKILNEKKKINEN
jgi:hypothetical protein